MLFIQKYSTHGRVRQVIIAARITMVTTEGDINIAVTMSVHILHLNVKIIVTKIEIVQLMTRTPAVDHLMVDAGSILRHLAVQLASVCITKANFRIYTHMRLTVVVTQANILVVLKSRLLLITFT